ncbi:MAG: hypothetical protein ACXVZ2_06985 [Gaiellaceae bacterium]
MTTSAYARVPRVRPTLDRLAAGAAVAGAALGLVVGIVELTAGPQIRTWVGNKLDTTRLGLTTIVLAAVALAAALTWLRRRDLSTDRRLLIGAGLLVPGLVGFTTVGRLWYVPGTLLVLAGLVLVVELRKDGAAVSRTLGEYWAAGLIAVLAVSYVFLGATALGVAGVLGIVGGIVVVATLAARSRLPRHVPLLLLCAAVVPFAVLTWWSVVTPLLALLLIVIGGLTLRADRRV